MTKPRSVMPNTNSPDVRLADSGKHRDEAEYVKKHGNFGFAFGLAITTFALSASVAAQQNPSPPGTSQGLVAQWQFVPEKLIAQQFTPSVGESKLDAKGTLSFLSRAGAVNAVQFDGRTTAVSGGRSIVGTLPTRNISVSAWARLQRTSDWGGLVGYLQDNGSFEKGWLLGYRDDRFCFGLASDGRNAKDQAGDGAITYLTAPQASSLDAWHHVVGTYDGTVMRLYVDGEEVATSREQHGDLLYPSNARFAVGAYQDRDEFYPMLGSLHSISIYDQVIEQARVRQLYQAKHGKLPSPTPPLRVHTGPIVRLVGRDQAELSWTTTELTPSRVEYGTSLHATELAADHEPKTEHSLVLSNLDSAQTYYYRLQDSNDDDARVSRTYSFDASFNYNPPKQESAKSPYLRNQGLSAAATRYLDLLQSARGYCVVLGGEEGQLAYELAIRSELTIVAIEPDNQKVQVARKKLSEAGLYGHRVSVWQAQLDRVAVADYVANLVVSETLLRTGDMPTPTDEVERIVRPAGGLAFLESDASIEPYRRPALEGAGEWTHQYGSADNTACSKDDRVKGDVTIQWWGRPGPRPMPDRGGRNPAPLSAGGFLFTQGDRILFSQDAYNGTIYWSLFIPEMRRSNIPRDCSNMAAAGDRLYVAVEDYCLGLHPVTGNSDVVMRVVSPDSADSDSQARLEQQDQVRSHDWGYVGYESGTLIGTSVKRGGAYQADEGEWYEDFKANQIDRVTSDALFAMDRNTGKNLWQYQDGPIINSTITIADEKVFFVESRGPSARQAKSARISNQHLLEATFLVALRLNSGKRVWEKQVDTTSHEFMTYLSFSNDKLLMAGTEKNKAFHHVAFDARSGKMLWETEQKTGKTHHSGHLDHPVVIGDRIYNNLHVMDLSTGNDVRESYRERRGCGTVAASNHMLFFRDHFHSTWDIESDVRQEYKGIRSGCWLGIVPAGGMILAPESSSGCSCTHAIQTSIGWAPVK